MFRLLAALIGVIAIVGCSSEQTVREGLPPNPKETVRSPEEQAALDRANQAMTAFDQELARTRGLPPAESYAAQAKLGSAVARLAETCRGTRFENRAWFLLAHWRYNFNDDGAGVDEALRELARCPLPILKSPGQALEVQHLVRQRRLPRAGELAARLRHDGQEIDPKDKRTIIADPYAGLVELVTHAQRAEERAEAPALPTVAVDLSTGQDRTVDGPGRDWRLVLSAGTVTPELVFQVRRFAEASTSLPLRIVLMLRDSSRVVILSQLAEPLAGLPVVVAYARTADEAAAWARDWGSAVEPMSTLIDPQGRCRGANLRPGDFSGLMASP